MIGSAVAVIAGYRALSFDLITLGFGPRTIGVLAAVVALLGSAYILRAEKNAARVILGLSGLVLFTILLSIEVLDPEGLLATLSEHGRWSLLLSVWITESWVLLLSEKRTGLGGRICGYVLMGIVMLSALTWNAFADFASRTFNYLLTLASTGALVAWVRLNKKYGFEGIPCMIATFAGALLLIIASAVETLDAGGMFSYLSENGRQVTLSIVWAAESIVFLVAFFWKRLSPLQVCGLVLFGITVIKILFVDLDNLETIYRTIVTMVVGIIALGASFVYVRNKDRIATLLSKK
jgi:uncharacterized membrane protein